MFAIHSRLEEGGLRLEPEEEKSASSKREARMGK